MVAPTRFNKLRDPSQPQVSRVQDNIDRTLTPVAVALSKTPLTGAKPVWTAFPFTASFANTVGLATAAYYKNGFNEVRAKGSLSSAAGVAAFAAVGTFPPGFRPGETQRKAVEGNGATAQFLSIAPTGIVTVEVAVAAGGSCDFDFTFLAER